MPNSKNGFWQLLAMGVVGLLTTIGLAWVASIAGEVDANTEARQQTKGAEIPARLKAVEKSLTRVDKGVVVVHGELAGNRRLLNRIAAERNLETEPDVAPLPTAEEE